MKVYKGQVKGQIGYNKDPKAKLVIYSHWRGVFTFCYFQFKTLWKKNIVKFHFFVV